MLRPMDTTTGAPVAGKRYRLSNNGTLAQDPFGGTVPSRQKRKRTACAELRGNAMSVTDECRRSAEANGWTFEVPKRNVYVMRKGRLEFSYHPASTVLTLIACPWKLNNWSKSRQVFVTAFGCSLDASTISKIAIICATLDEKWLQTYFLERNGRMRERAARDLAACEEDLDAILAVTPRDA